MKMRCAIFNFLASRKYIFLACFLVILISLIPEIVLRLFYVREARRPLIYDKDLGWRGKPFEEGVYICNKNNIKTKYKYNEYGFRDENFSPAPSPFTRIVITGDSCVEGLEVEYENTFFRLLENHLNKNTDVQFEVINISSACYSTAQELIALRKYWDIIKPDIVLLVFYTGDDISNNLRNNFLYLTNEGQSRSNRNKKTWIKNDYLAFKRWAYENSYLVFFLKNFIESSMKIQIMDDAKKHTCNMPDKNKITGLLLTKMKYEIKKDGTLFGIIVLPSKKEINHNDNTKVDYIVEHCNNEDIPCLSLYNILNTLHYFEYAAHLNESGHMAVEKEMYKFLLNKTQFIQLALSKRENEKSSIE